MMRMVSAQAELLGFRDAFLIVGISSSSWPSFPG